MSNVHALPGQVMDGSFLHGTVESLQETLALMAGEYAEICNVLDGKPGQTRSIVLSVEYREEGRQVEAVMDNRNVVRLGFLSEEAMAAVPERGGPNGPVA